MHHDIEQFQSRDWVDMPSGLEQTVTALVPTVFQSRDWVDMPSG